MNDKELRKLIGSRARQRRMELNLNQKYVAEKMDVNSSTIQRYESGTIDNTKKLVLEGLADVLHVSVEWLRGETDEYETRITNKRDLRIRDLMSDILHDEPENLDKNESAFAKDILIYLLEEYRLFLDSFENGCENYKKNSKNKDIAKAMEFTSTKEYNEIMFLREVMHSINAYNDISEVIRLYSRDAAKASERLKNLMTLYESGE